MKPRILVVDDDENNLLMLSIKLERDGYDVQTASNGLEAIVKVQSFRPDLVLMDVIMPQMDGYEALRWLKSREETRYIPVIMLTGRADIEDKVHGFEVGAEDYINKPYSLVEVSARVKSLLRMRALQSRLRDTEKMAALGEIVDGIAHEIRNPLTAIGGIARRLHENESEPRHREYASLIIKSVERLERMVQRIDEYKRILVSNPAPNDINKVVGEAASEIREFIDALGKRITVSENPGQGLPRVNMDSGNIKSAVFNVLQNSVEAIEKEGEITIATYLEDRAVIIRIEDNGIGISPENLRNIFNPFQTSKFERSGLGLTMTYRIVQDHGGEIELKSEPGKGTTAFIKLPSMKQA